MTYVNVLRDSPSHRAAQHSTDLSKEAEIDNPSSAFELCCLWKGSVLGHHWWVGLGRSLERLHAASELFGVWA